MDSESFKENVHEDIKRYITENNNQPGCVLIFPPVDNYRRFLIHNSVSDFDNLCSFSIGQGGERRTVISDKSNLITRGQDHSSPSSPVPEPVPKKERIRDRRRPDRPVYVPKGRVCSKEITAEETKPNETSPTMSKQKGTPKPKKDDKPVPAKEEEEEDDWDSLFTDDGDCLKPDMIKELTTAVKNVRIVPAPSVSAAVEKETEAVLDEYSHVLEVSKFPSEFKTQDLMMLFMQYKESGFEIKWVDDTHALVVFSSAKIANEVMENKYPGVRLKKLSEASAESKGRAKRSGATMKPYKARPETCPALARRLVTGALGMKSKASKETLENERRILREAKEKKMLAKKEQKDIWDDDEAS